MTKNVHSKLSLEYACKCIVSFDESYEYIKYYVADTFYGSWFNHVKEFYKASEQNPNIHILFYEETKQVKHQIFAYDDNAIATPSFVFHL